MAQDLVKIKESQNISVHIGLLNLFTVFRFNQKSKVVRLGFTGLIGESSEIASLGTSTLMFESIELISPRFLSFLDRFDLNLMTNAVIPAVAINAPAPIIPHKIVGLRKGAALFGGSVAVAGAGTKTTLTGVAESYELIPAVVRLAVTVLLTTELIEVTPDVP